MSAPLEAEVASYLAVCARYSALLSPVCHPTEDGAVKLIWHRGPEQAEQIRAAFRAAVADRAARRRARRGQDDAQPTLAGSV